MGEAISRPTAGYVGGISGRCSALLCVLHTHSGESASYRAQHRIRSRLFIYGGIRSVLHRDGPV